MYSLSFSIHLPLLLTLAALYHVGLADNHIRRAHKRIHRSGTVEKRAVVSGPWSLAQQGLAPLLPLSERGSCRFFSRTTGVSGMQLAIVSENTAIIYDKVYVACTFFTFFH